MLLVWFGDLCLGEFWWLGRVIWVLEGGILVEFDVLGEISLPRTHCGGGCRFWFWF